VLALLDISDFRRLWLGQLTSVFGTWLLVVAVPLYVYDLTGSTVATGATFIAETLPALLLGPLAGVLVDRLDRRRVMIGSDVVRGFAVLSMLFASGQRSLWVLYLAMLVENGAAQLFRPARQALIPCLVGTPQRLTQANAMFAMIDGLVRLVGSVLGGVLYLAIGFPGLVVLNASSYLISALACRQVRHRAPAHGRRSISLSGTGRELRAGLRHVMTTPPLRRLLRVTAVFYLANGAVTALLVPYARAELRAGPTSFGYLLMALGVGYVVGTLLAHWIIDRLSPDGAVVAAVPMLAASYLLAFQPVSYPATLIGFAAAGAPAIVLLVAVQTEYQRRTPDALLGRVAAAFLTVEMAVAVTGAALGSALAAQVGVLPVIDVALLVLGALALTLPQQPTGWRLLPGPVGPDE
jgi:predicted MFS family arabinose efflux permease